jgi:hypothetical protein
LLILRINVSAFTLQLCLFVNACDGDVDRASQMLVKHYEIRKKAPQLFTNRDPKSKEMTQCFANQFYVNLPTPTPNDHLVCLFSLANSTAKNYVYDTSTRCFLMMIGKHFEPFSSVEFLRNLIKFQRQRATNTEPQTVSFFTLT